MWNKSYADHREKAFRGYTPGVDLPSVEGKGEGFLKGLAKGAIIGTLYKGE